MNNPIVKNIIRFLFLVLLQVFILDKIQLNGYINPYVYPLFILLLPVDISKGLLLVIAFITGLSIDLFSGILGLHAAATVFMAFCRPSVFNLIGLKEDIEPGLEPNSGNFGIFWFITYASILVVLHHLFFFYLEVFRISEFSTTLLRVLISSFTSIFLIIIIQFLFVKRNE